MFQVLYVQQNAVTHLLAALGIEISPKDYPRLSRIRKVRDASIGHPTKSSSKGESSYHFITRVSVSKGGFTLMSDRPDGSTAWEGIGIPGMISQQRADLADVLQRVVTALEQEEEQHRAEHRGERMEDLLPATLSYHFSKIAEAMAGETSAVGAALGLASLHTVREALERFREALVRRGLDETWHLNESIDEIVYPLKEIEGYFEAVKRLETPHINNRLSYICSFFAARRIEALRDTAREIDEVYRRPSSEKA